MTDWKPQAGPQTLLIKCPVFEVFFGGARGGGKTFGMLLEWVFHQERYGGHCSGLMVRRTYKQLDDTIKAARDMFFDRGAIWRDSEQKFIFPNGSEIKFRHLEHDSDAEHYQGHSYTRLYIEEVTNFPSQEPIMRLMATLRSAHGIPVGFRATGNPGGPGHQWCKTRWIDQNPSGMEIIGTDYTDPFTGTVVTRQRTFIPAKLRDNAYLDPIQYQATLQSIGNEELVKAWLLGDWTAVVGAFFDNFSLLRHVIKPIEIPRHWLRFKAMDWGSAKPFCVLWFAVATDTTTVYANDDAEEKITVHVIPRGALVCYREYYGVKTKQNGEFIPNVGLKLDVEDVAAGILHRELDEPKNQTTGRAKIAYGVLDPAAWQRSGGPCIAERLARQGVMFDAADNRRTNRDGRMGGWNMVRHRLNGEDGLPMLYILSHCKHLIRTLPALQHDQSNAEDINTDDEDHAADALRYACMSRPWIAKGLPLDPETQVTIIASQLAAQEPLVRTDPMKPVLGPTINLETLFRDHEEGERRRHRLRLAGRNSERI